MINNSDGFLRKVWSSMWGKPLTGELNNGDALYGLNGRGRIYFIGDKCTGCGDCEAACPVDALSIVLIGSGYPEEYGCHLNNGRCILCNECVGKCLRRCLYSSADPTRPETVKENLTMQMD